MRHSSRLASFALPLTAVLATAALAACEEDNPGFCGDDCPADAAVDAREGCMANPGLCTADEDCLDDVCVDCTSADNHQNADCTEPAAPVCDSNRDCRECRADTECDSGLCDHGLCPPATTVLFVRPNGDPDAANNCLNPATPCKTVTQALTQVPAQAGDPVANRRYIKLLTVDTYAEPGQVTIDDKSVVIIGPPLAGGDRAVLDRSGNGPTLVINNGSTVRLERVAVNGSVNNLAADGIVCSDATLDADNVEVHNNAGTGIAGDGCKLTLRNSLVTRNAEGGISVQRERVVIVNTVIADNGGGLSGYGGLHIQGAVLATSVIQSNTVFKNQANAATQSDGIQCDVPGLTILNPIIYGTADRFRVGGSCTFAHVVFGPTDNGGRLAAGTGNVMVAAEADFEFTDPGTRNYHIGPTSFAKGKGTTTGLAAEAMTDMDGQPRPQGAADVGADEIPD